MKTMLPHLIQLRERCRALDDLLRADQRLNLQMQAILRRGIPGIDEKKKKAQVMKIMRALDKAAHPLDVIDNLVVSALYQSRATLREQIAVYRKAIEHETESLAIASFCQTVKGLGLLSLGRIIGACQSQYEPGEVIGEEGHKASALHGNVLLCANPAKVWKRMGVGIMPDGTRQRRVKGDAAIAHGYSPERRSMLYVIGVNLIKANDPYYGALYRERKQWKTEKEKQNPEWCYKKKTTDVKTGAVTYGSPMIGKINKVRVHLDALRYVQKRLLLKLWQRVEQIGLDLSVKTNDATKPHTSPIFRTLRRKKETTSATKRLPSPTAAPSQR